MRETTTQLASDVLQQEKYRPLVMAVAAETAKKRGRTTSGEALAPRKSRPEIAGRARVLSDGAVAAQVISLVEAAGWLVLGPDESGNADVAIVVTDAASVPDLETAAAQARGLEANAKALVVPTIALELLGPLVRSELDCILLSDRLESQLPAALVALKAGLVVSSSALRTVVERPALTVREKQVLAMVVIGFSNADIARKLFVTESTVKSHLSSVFAKLNVRTRNEATALILDASQGVGTGILAIVGDRNGETIATPEWQHAAQ